MSAHFDRNRGSHCPSLSQASLALTWFIPSFEAEPESLDTARRSTLIIEGKDLDFRKPFAGIDRVEIGWRWLP